jgi:histidyl-tRNA synthetase
MVEFKTVRGMRDFLPEEAKIMRYIEDKARRVAELYGYKEIITPVLEPYELLAAKAGEEIRLRMYTFKDLGERMVAMRPEFTPSVARLVATTLRNEPKPFRLFCVGSLYRYDEPQQGRYREFWQSNFELMGSDKPEADAEIILLTNSLMTLVGLRNHTFKIGHVGVLRGVMSGEELDEKVQNGAMQLMDKKQYNEAFRLIEEAGSSSKCIATLRKLVKLRGGNLGIIEKMKQLVKNYEEALKATENLQQILKLVKASECKIEMTVEAGFARGLEYYTGIIFEVNVPEMDKALAGGGRYDRLIALFGGEPTPAVGVAHGIDRIMLAFQLQKTTLKTKDERKTMIIPISEELNGEALKISQMLRDADISVEVEVTGRKVSKALEDANRKKMDYAIIVGEKELREGSVVVRNLVKREQKIVKIKKIAETIKGQSG